MKVKIIIDSTFCPSKETVEKYDVTVVPLTVNIDNNSYADNIEITIPEVIDAVADGKKVSTSQPSPLLFTEALESARDKGYKEALVLTMSSTLSGTYQAALIGASDVEGIRFSIFDTKTTSVGADQFLDIAIEQFEEGKTLDEVVSLLTVLTERTRTIISITDLTNLVRGGRISSIKGAIASFLHAKPMVEYTAGKAKVQTKLRTDKQVFYWVAKMIKEDIKDAKNVYIYIANVDARERMEKLFAIVKSEVPHAKFKTSDNVTSVIAIHTGYKVVGIGWVYLD